MPPKLARRDPEDFPLFVRDNINSIHDICNTLGWTYTDVARATGLTLTSISAYTAGVTIPRKDNYNKLAAFFDWEVWK